MSSVRINDIDMYETFKAPLAERHSVQPPVPKTFFQDVPGADGSLDLSTAISGRPTYERREITMTFNSLHAIENWPTVLTRILKEFHGKHGKIVFADEPDYYYVGRMTVSDYERNRDVGSFIISANAEPYKYEIYSSLEEWLWDPFNFETGVIRSYGKIIVNGEHKLMIPGTEKWVIPEFTATGSISLKFEGQNHVLTAGTTKIYGVVIKEGLNELFFSGKGTVSVDYRGGVL